MMFVLLKATLPQPSHVRGHLRGLRYVLPYQSIRHKTIEPAPNQPKLPDEENKQPRVVVRVQA